MVQCPVSGSTTAGSCGLSLTLSLSQANAFRDLATPTQAHAIAHIEDDELVEVTPKAIWIRKRFLDPHERKRAARKLEAA